MRTGANGKGRNRRGEKAMVRVPATCKAAALVEVGRPMEIMEV
jgi:hypothetical protein